MTNQPQQYQEHDPSMLTIEQLQASSPNFSNGRATNPVKTNYQNEQIATANEVDPSSLETFKLSREIFDNAVAIEELYTFKIASDRRHYLEGSLGNSTIKKLFGFIVNDYLKPPGHQKPLVSLYDVQSIAGRYGGALMQQAEGYRQDFFWLPESTSAKNLGEFAFVRHKVDPRTNLTTEVVAHIHYVVSKNSVGQTAVTKYQGSNLYNRERSERVLVTGPELINLQTVSTQLKDKLTAEWRPTDSNKTSDELDLIAAKEQISDESSDIFSAQNKSAVTGATPQQLYFPAHPTDKTNPQSQQQAA